MRKKPSLNGETIAVHRLKNLSANRTGVQVSMPRFGIKTLIKKGQAYKNVFDPAKGWFRPRKADVSLVCIGGYRDSYMGNTPNMNWGN